MNKASLFPDKRISNNKNGYIINTEDIDYKELNRLIRLLLKIRKEEQYLNKEMFSHEIIELNQVLGQRYIGDGIRDNIKIIINGIPGNNLGAFMNGPEIEVFGNVQDATGNTMNEGRIIIHGNAGDVTGYSMRGGEIFIRNNVGYRSGIHMKSYMEKFPVIVIGGKAGNFLGEYMAGGIIIVLGTDKNDFYKSSISFFEDDEPVGNFVGTGMHGGAIYVYGDISNHKLGKEIIKSHPDEMDKSLIMKYIDDYCRYFDVKNSKFDPDRFAKLEPFSKRPYGNLYAY